MDEYSVEFDRLRRNRVEVSYHKYGPARKNFGEGRVDALETAQLCLDAFRRDHNTEHLVDAANYLMFRWMFPMPGEFFRATWRTDCMSDNNTLRRIAEQLGPEEILCQCAEECSELAQAVLKMRRVLVGTTPLTQSEARVLINEEVADVLNCVEALEAISFVDRGQVARIQAEKLGRWDRRTRGA